MKNKFLNRLGSFQTSLGVLNKDPYKSLWTGNQTLMFTRKVSQAADAVDSLEQFCQEQGIQPFGPAGDKAREEAKLIKLALPLARALVVWFTDRNNTGDAAKVDFTRSDWQRFRDGILVGKARLVRDLAGAAANGDTAAAAAGYKITPDRADALDAQITVYAPLVTAPQQAISDHKTLTDQAQERFNAVEQIFAQLDDLILSFDETPVGSAMISAYQNARIVRDLGHGPGNDEPTPPPPASPPPAPSASPDATPPMLPGTK